MSAEKSATLIKETTTTVSGLIGLLQSWLPANAGRTPPLLHQAVQSQPAASTPTNPRPYGSFLQFSTDCKLPTPSERECHVQFEFASRRCFVYFDPSWEQIFGHVARELAGDAGGWVHAFDIYPVVKHFETHQTAIAENYAKRNEALEFRIRESLESSLRQLESDARHRYSPFQEMELTRTLIYIEQTKLVLLSEKIVEATWKFRHFRGRFGVKVHTQFVVLFFRHENSLVTERISIAKCELIAPEFSLKEVKGGIKSLESVTGSDTDGDTDSDETEVDGAEEEKEDNKLSDMDNETDENEVNISAK